MERFIVFRNVVDSAVWKIDCYLCRKSINCMLGKKAKEKL